MVEIYVALIWPAFAIGRSHNSKYKAAIKPPKKLDGNFCVYTAFWIKIFIPQLHWPSMKKQTLMLDRLKHERMKGMMIFNMNSMQRMQEVRRLRMCWFSYGITCIRWDYMDFVQVRHWMMFTWKVSFSLLLFSIFQLICSYTFWSFSSLSESLAEWCKYHHLFSANG